jgi:hypothetical protein
MRQSGFTNPGASAMRHRAIVCQALEGALLFPDEGEEGCALLLCGGSGGCGARGPWPSRARACK